MLLAHAHTLRQARSALAELSDRATNLNASSAYEYVLILLDSIHGENCPAIDPSGLPADQSALIAHAVRALVDLHLHGVDELHVELLLAHLHDARVLELD